MCIKKSLEWLFEAGILSGSRLPLVCSKLILMELCLKSRLVLVLGWLSGTRKG